MRVCILNVQVYLWVDDWKDRWVDMDGWISRQVGRWVDRLLDRGGWIDE